MKLHTLTSTLIALLLSPPLHAALTHDPALQWQSLESEHFIVHFHDGEQAMAQDTAVIAERVHTRLNPSLGWVPEEKTHLVLSDRYDFTNGWTTFFPYNHITLITLPPDDLFGLEEFDHWMETLITHEYTHTLHLDKGRDAAKGMRSILGRFPLLFPDAYQPSWFVEGIATYMETDDAKAIGRGQSSYYRGLMRTEWLNGIKSLRQANQPLVSWPGGQTPYLYGVYFYRFVTERYGEAKRKELIDHYSGNLIPFLINTNSRIVLGKELEPLWQEFNQYLAEKFGPEAATIKAAGLTPGERLSTSGYNTGAARTLPDGTVYFIHNNQERSDRLMRLTPGAQRAEPVADVHGRLFDAHPSAGIVLTQLDLTRNTNYFSDIYHIDPTTGRITQLTSGGRYRHVTWAPDGRRMVATHFELGKFSLHLLDAQGKAVETLWQATDDTIIGALDWSPRDNRVVASVWRGGHWDLELFDVVRKQWQRLTHTRDVESQPQFDASGSSIVYTADYGRVFNIQRISLVDGRTETLTNELGGAFQPALSADGNTLYYAALGPNGNDLYRLPVNPRPAAPPRTLSSAYVPLPGQAPAPYPVSDYKGLGLLRPTWWFPYWLSDPVRNEVGLMTSGADPLYRHQYSVTGAYDLKNNWAVGSLIYAYDRWRPILKLYATRSSVEYTSASGIFNRLRFHDYVIGEVEYPFLRYLRQWAVHAGVSIDDEKDARLAPGAWPAYDNLDRVAGVALTYNSAREYPRSVSPAYGRQINLVAESSDLMSSDYQGKIERLDWRELIGLGRQHVLSLRASGGHGEDGSRPFKLGGVFSDYPALPGTPNAQSVFSRRSFALRGYPEGVALGNEMLLGSDEWRFPIALVERGAMAPPVGIHQWHGKLFMDVGRAWYPDGPSSPWRRGAGAELIADMVFGYNLGVMLGIGVAKGFDLGGENQLYIRLGSSF